MRAMRHALGEQQFGGLCATLQSDDDRRAVEHALAASDVAQF